MRKKCIETSGKKAYARPDFNCIKLVASDIIATSDKAGGTGEGYEDGWG